MMAALTDALDAVECEDLLDRHLNGSARQTESTVYITMLRLEASERRARIRGELAVADPHDLAPLWDSEDSEAAQANTGEKE